MLGSLLKLWRPGKKRGEADINDNSLAARLRKGGMISFALLDVPELSGKRFEITGGGRYDFDGEIETDYALQSTQGTPVWLCVVRKNGAELIAVSRRLKRGEALDLWGEEQISAVLEEGFNAKLECANLPESLQGWAAERYHQSVDGATGHYSEGVDPSPERDGDPLDYYCLENGSEDRAVEIEVYEGGETEISLTVFLPTTAIEEAW